MEVKSLDTILKGMMAMVVAGMLSVLVSPPAGALPTQKSVPPQWTPCAGAPAIPARECAEIDVPLDYTNPAKGTAPLQLARIKASNPDPSAHQGTLFFVPGGPPSCSYDPDLLPPQLPPDLGPVSSRSLNTTESNISPGLLRQLCQ